MHLLMKNTAITTILSDTESSFRAEMQSKQSLIDQTHSKLRETTALLNEERRRLTDLQGKSDERKALRQRIANLRRANDRERSNISNGHNGRPGSAPTAVRADIKVGEADAGLEIDTAIILPTLLDSSDPSSISGRINKSSLNLTSHQRDYLISLPSPAVLLARATAYGKNNHRLEAQAKALQSQSSELEEKLRRIIGLCTGMQSDVVEEMVPTLCAAVESETDQGDVEVGRVREFLRRVEGGGQE